MMDELERLGNMYEKGLLTEDEFAIAKKKLLDG
ncbi:MAG: SHOCT domain-containing protein [Methanobrevibacter sp.]|nr:SHOCT domain-containing protein [Methanobrevibacter sp.]